MSKRPNAAERAYMGRVADLGCVVCQQPAQVHHLTGAGMGLRAAHSEIIPLCMNHHTGNEGIHTIGKRTWQERYGYEREFLELVKEALA